jgi:hypothetical protein
MAKQKKATRKLSKKKNLSSVKTLGYGNHNEVLLRG